MIESPDITLMHESLRHIRQGFEQVGDIWRHEGLKKGVEQAMWLASQSGLGRGALMLASGPSVNDDRLNTQFGDINLDGPTGIGPGWDKTGKTPLAWQYLGANHITLGAVPMFSQKGSRMPRLYTFDHRIGDHGLSKSLNSYGFYSPGRDVVKHRVERLRQTGLLQIPIFVQVTLNKELYEEQNRSLIPGILAATIREVLPIADGINLGLSSPNTFGMRDAQDQEEFTRSVVGAAREVTPDHIPLTYKGDADGGERRLDMYARLVEEFRVKLELINSTAKAEIKAKYGAENHPGGLAGADPEFQQMGIGAVSYIYEAVGDKTEIIGLAGINSNDDQSVRMLRAGASLLGVVSGVPGDFPRVMKHIDGKVRDHLDTLPSGKDTLQHIIGVDTKRGAKAA